MREAHGLAWAAAGLSEIQRHRRSNVNPPLRTQYNDLRGATVTTCA
jgi:hypothetical protein